MTTVLIADHHPITRKGIVSLLRNSESYDIVGKVSNGNELYELLKEKSPDVLIMELDLPQINGIMALRTIKKEFTKLKVIIFSSHPEEMYALSAIKAGASAYLSKTVSTKILKKAVERVARGGIYLNDTLTQQLANGTTNDNNMVVKYKKLSSREIEVLNLLSSGKRNKDIASTLAINEKTVSTYKTRLLKKLKVDNLADLIHQSRLLHIS
ncbi:response regulator [Aquimarina sp. 2-A2]|uniref:LuxR family two component transcriptional regulator n=1 Tax=Aquimarina intermedia TaxID=350814 RepID=A0A5S5C990_9FLAO|nr:response regulator transcription factor [Aquimarina intermedia]TYP75867.1 LuxR family two component transcriptional regulator [Aquimarina intermedia]